MIVISVRWWRSPRRGIVMIPTEIGGHAVLSPWLPVRAGEKSGRESDGSAQQKTARRDLRATPINRSFSSPSGGPSRLMPVVTLLGLSIFTALATTVRADEFERLEGVFLFDIPGRAGTRAPSALTYRDLEALPPALRDERAPLVIVKTDQGNLAKVLVTAAFKKLMPADQGAASVPVLILERFETIDAGDRRSFKARGKGVTLFDGFQFDLDIGQVVPDRAGGDIVFMAHGSSEPRLTAAGTSRLYTLEKPLPASSPVAGRPSSGRAILPGDFNGRFDLVADGQWSGRLDLAVDAEGTVSGSFRSDKNGTAYPVTGKTGEGVPQRIRFEVRFPRARQSYDGLIWSEGKNVIAGTVSMLDHPYSFVAIRQGASLGSRSTGLAPAEPKKDGK